MAGLPSRRTRAPIFGLALAVVALWGGGARADCAAPFGEVTGDGLTNVTDVQCVIIEALSQAEGGPAPACLSGGPADLNCDAAVNVGDVQLAIGAALHLPLDPSVDGDHDSCPDSCQPDPTAVGAAAPGWQLQDFQPQSPGFETTYGLDAFKGRVTVVALLASW